MGNDNSSKIGQNFHHTCHPAFTQYQLEESQQLLFSYLKLEESFLIWRKLVDPLFEKRHLLTPVKIIAHEQFTDYGCCTQEDFHRTDVQYKKIYYQPYIYTFDKEIISRKNKNICFREQEIWKVIGYMTLAVNEWMSVYPNQKIGIICPFNLVINNKGQMRVVCRLSFFNNEYSQAESVYSPPQSREISIIKNSLNPHSDPGAIQSSSVYSIGIVILQAMTLQLTGISHLQTIDKQNMLYNYNNYSPQLKQLTRRMIDHNQSIRPKISYLEQKVKQNKSKRIL